MSRYVVNRQRAVIRASAASSDGDAVLLLEVFAKYKSAVVAALDHSYAFYHPFVDQTR